jgi:hypothetical protein
MKEEEPKNTEAVSKDNPDNLRITVDTIEEFYKQWRWLLYNKLDILTLQFTINGKHGYYLNEKYSNQIIERFITRDFEVSIDQIENHDKTLIEEYENSNFRLYCPKRSIFIENCLLIVDQYNSEDLINKIKRNLIYYYWWDEITFERLILETVNSYFLMSTRNLIGIQSLIDYIHDRFNTKEDLINQLLSNFVPRDYSIGQMNGWQFRGRVIFDYEWLFSNEVKKSIRIFENECRFDFNEKIIGSFYNENLLFREIRKKFTKQFTVISQGSPEWLRPQRFDIYIPEINVAIEYQGAQHSYPVDFGGKGKKIAKQQFQENLKRDNLKITKAKENGCHILFVYPEYEISHVFSELNNLIKQKLDLSN